MILKGRTHKYGDHVNTDVIIPARYLNVSDADELAAHCMEDIDAEFVKRVKPGDVIIGGEDFGCGSSREHAPIAIKAAGISAVIARSFARIFFRNAINIGLPALVSPQATAEIQANDELEIDLATGTIRDVTRGATYQAQPFPDFLREIMAAGGLIAHTRRRLGSAGA
jgi:3-isopropylmalate/(R)-2-methylmalate dehydratase small subunit